MPGLVMLEPSTVKRPDKLNKLALETNRSLTSVIHITVEYMLVSIDDAARNAAPTASSPTTTRPRRPPRRCRLLPASRCV